MLEEITKQLRRDESEVLSAYQDHLGYWTIGIGRLIDKRKHGGISKEESAILLSNDITKRVAALDQAIPWWKDLDEARKGVLLNMSFQMGVEGLLDFKNTLNMVRNKQFADAAKGMLNSKWAGQTPARALRLSNQMRDGKWY